MPTSGGRRPRHIPDGFLSAGDHGRRGRRARLRGAVRAVILAAGRVVADAPTEAILADAPLLARHDLELPACLAPGRIAPRG